MPAHAMSRAHIGHLCKKDSQQLMNLLVLQIMAAFTHETAFSAPFQIHRFVSLRTELLHDLNQQLKLASKAIIRRLPSTLRLIAQSRWYHSTELSQTNTGPKKGKRKGKKGESGNKKSTETAAADSPLGFLTHHDFSVISTALNTAAFQILAEELQVG